MSLSKTKRFLRAALAAALAAVLVALAPGIASYEAAAQVVTGSMGAGRGAGAPVAPVGLVNGGGVAPVRITAALAPALGRSALNFSAAPSASFGLSAAPAEAFSPAAAPAALPASALLAPSAVPSPVAGAAVSNARSDAPASALRMPHAGVGEGAPVAARDQLAQTVKDLESADGANAKTGFLDKLFTGARSLFGLKESAPAGVSSNASASFAALTPAPARLLPASPDASKADSSDRATPPSPVVQVSDGLKPGSKLLAGAPAAAAPGKNDAGYTPEEVKRAVWGLTANRFFSLISISISAIAYPLMVIAAVHATGFYDLSTWAALANIPLSLLAGRIGDIMPLKKYAVFNVVLRGAISIVTALLFAGGFMTYGPLLVMTVLSAWQFASLFNTEPALQTEVNGTDVGRNRSTESLIRMTTIFVTVVTGLALGAAAIHFLGYFWTFMMIGGIQMIPAYILWKTLPNGGRMSRSRIPSWAQAKGMIAELARSWARRTKDFLSTAGASVKGLVSSGAFWRRAAMAVGFAAALAAFFIPIPGLPFLLKSPILLVVASALLKGLIAELAGFWARRRVKEGISNPGASSASSSAFWRQAATVGGLAAALAVFFIPIPGLPFLLKSPVPFVVVSALLLWRSKIYQTVIKPAKLLKTSLLFVIIGAFIETPLRNSILSVMANEINPATAASYLGSMVAAFYLGQAPSGTGVLDPKLTITVAGLGPWKFTSPLVIPFQRTMKWIFALGTAAWVNFVLIPKGALAAGLHVLGLGGLMAAAPLLVTSLAVAAISVAVVAGYFALHNLTPKIQDSTWMRIEAGALLFMSFPLLFWGAPWAMYLALAVFGFVLNGSQRLLSATFNVQAKKAAPEHYQFLTGIRGSFFNVATSIAYAIYGLAKIAPAYWGDPHAFPFTWYVLAAIYAVFAVMFWKGSGVFKSAKQAQAAANPAEKK